VGRKGGEARQRWQCVASGSRRGQACRPPRPILLVGMRLRWRDCGHGSDDGGDGIYGGSVEGVTGEEGGELRRKWYYAARDRQPGDRPGLKTAQFQLAR
jgi:hypothetical protein